MAAMIEVQQVSSFVRFGQYHLAGVAMAGEKRHKNGHVSGQRIERETVLQFAQIERRRLRQTIRDKVYLGDDLGQIDVDPDRRGKPDALGAGKVAVSAIVGAESEHGKMPVVGTGVVLFIASADSAFQFAENERALPFPVQGVGVRFLQGHAIVRDVQGLDALGVRVQGADPLDETASGRSIQAPFAEDNPFHLEVFDRPRRVIGRQTSVTKRQTRGIPHPVKKVLLVESVHGSRRP